MSKKKPTLRHSADLESIDDELSAAMDQLDGANSKVVELLQSYDEPEEGEKEKDEG